MSREPRGPTRRALAALLAVSLVGFAVSLVGFGGRATAADAGKITVGVAVIGVETRATEYEVTVECSTKIGTLRAPRVTMRVSAGTTQTLGPTELP